MGIAYRPEFDGLRAIAVLAVLAYHAGLGGAGFVGVDVFFVISGYLITSLLLREYSDTGRIDLLAFYARRVRRIFPMAILVVLVVLALSRLLLASDAQVGTANAAGASAIFGANFYFQSVTGGYWSADAHQMPLLHFWSLAVEEQFYLFWPLLLLAILRYRPAWLKPAMWSLAAASLLVAEWLAPNAAFYEMPARFWELAAGGLIAAAPMRAMPRWTATLGVLVTLAACLLPMPTFPGIGALPAVAGACLVVVAIHGGSGHALLRSRPMVGIGLVSYSLYLWHWPLLAIYRATTIGPGQLHVRLLLCAAALLLALASYRCVEQPFRRMRFPKGRVVIAGVGLSLATALSACVLDLQSAVPPVVDPFPLATQAEQDLPPSGCRYVFNDTTVPKCPDPVGATVAIWGDSMAYAWRPAFPAPVVDYSRDSCPPLVGWLPDNPQPGDLLCRDFNTAVAARVGQSELVLVALWTPAKAKALRKTLESVAGKVERIVVIGPTPEMHDRVPRCIRQQAESRCAITRAEFDATAKPILVLLRSVAAGYPNVKVVDMTDRFCIATSCPPVLDGVPLYWDSHHVSASAARAYRAIR